MLFVPQQVDKFPDVVPESHWVVEGYRSAEVLDSPISCLVAAADGELALLSLETGQGRNRLGQTVPVPLLDGVKWDGRNRPVKWKYVRTTRDTKSPRVRFWFKSDAPKMEMDSLWVGSVDGGPVEHTLTVRNLSGDSVTFTPPESLAVGLKRLPAHDVQLWFVDKGAGGPTSDGVHVVPLKDGVVARVRSTPYSADQPRDAIPWASVHDATARQGVYFGVESSARVRLSFAATHQGQVVAQAGTDIDEKTGQPSVTRLGPGGTYTAPSVFIGCYDGDVDDGSNALRHWVARSLRPPTTASLPLATLNTWGNGMVIDERRSLAMADLGAQMGMELFHIDAGWFRGPGDWRPDPQKFPNGIRLVSDYVRSKGMKFGLWLAWTQAGVGDDSKDSDLVLNAFSRKDWLATPQPPGWRPDEFIGTDLCMSVPEAQDWCVALLKKLVVDYRIDILEHDQRMAVQLCDQSVSRSLWGHDHPHTSAASDVSRLASEGYYRVQDAVRAAFPNLLFEDCVNGGRMVDYGVVRRATYISITDVYDPLSNRQAFYDASYALPPAMCECYVQAMPTRNDAEFLTMLRSGMMGWFSLMQDPTRWTSHQVALATAEVARYKAVLRPLIASGHLFHLTPRPLAGRYDSIQYAARDGLSGAAYVFRNGAGPDRLRLKWRGLKPERTYSFGWGDTEFTATGKSLMTTGTDVPVKDLHGSEIVVVQAMP